MAARDKIHGAVKNALIKDGWTITDDPFVIEFKDLELEADMAAERTLAAERGTERIAVEVKSFLSASPVRDLQQAFGQYEMYRLLLKRIEPDRVVFLAISEYTWLDFFQRESVKAIRDATNLRIIVVDIETEEITQWIGKEDTAT